MKVRREGGWGGVIGGYHVGCHTQKHHGKTSWDKKKKKKTKQKSRNSAFI